MEERIIKLPEETFCILEAYLQADERFRPADRDPALVFYTAHGKRIIFTTNFSKKKDLYKDMMNDQINYSD